MNFFKSRRGAAVVLVFVVIFSTLFGSHRSLAAEAGKITAQNQNVMKDLQTRAAVGANLYAVADRYLATDDFARNRLFSALRLLEEKGVAEPMGQQALLWAAELVFEALEGAELSGEEAKYLSGFQAQLKSIENTLSHDPYNALAEEFNNTTLGSFPASLLGPLTGVRDLPVYH